MSETSTTAIITSAPDEFVSTAAGRQCGTWVRWLLPSIADIIFIVFTSVLAFSPLSAGLLYDADTGWHIRNGESILATGIVPRTDSFSYTRAGAPWFAWEWLYDLIIGAIHRCAGLNGVVLFTAVIIAVTFALLFRFLFRRSGSFAAALSLTLLAACAAEVHMLARPHVLSWLFTVLWVEVLYRFEAGNRSALFWLLPLMLLWVNMHGGFVLGIVLVVLFGCADAWEYQLDGSRENQAKLVQLATVLFGCLAVTFVTPYGYKLHWHVYQYLSSGFLMNSINEFMSPNFHFSGYRYFEVFILLMGAGLAFARDRITARDLVLVLFSVHAGLYAARNIPLAAIIMSFSMTPMLVGMILPGKPGPQWLNTLGECIRGISKDMGAMEKRFRGHGVAIAIFVIAVVIVLNGGRVGTAQVMSAHFSENRFPVKATEFIAAKGIRGNLFNADDWSGYLIYKLYPQTKLYFDDRHDFYGEAFIKEFLKASNGTQQWQEPLDKYHVRWVIISRKSPLASILRENKAWRSDYEDDLADIFERVQ